MSAYHVTFFSVVGSFLLLSGLHAQSSGDSLYALPPVTIGALSLRGTGPGEQVYAFDSIQLRAATHGSLADLLNGASGAYIKSYGLGSLATSSLRGAAAAQTAVTWNGIPLQSPMLGLIDLALLPVVAADQAAIQYGSNGASWGSGAVGGVLAFSNQTPDRAGLQLRIGSAAGSWGFHSHQGVAKWMYGKWSGATRLFFQSAQNDFPTAKGPQTNAAALQKGLIQELYFRPTPAQLWSLHCWTQANDRQIPPTATQTKSLAQQQDSVFRSTLQWRWSPKRATLQARTAFFREKINYNDEQIRLQAPSRFDLLLLETEYHLRWNRYLQFQAGANHSTWNAVADGYEQGVREQRQSVFLLLRASYRSLQAQFSARQEWQDGRAVPFIPGLGLEYSLFKKISLQARVNRHFRLPTLNDRFWMPGGNPDLLPETGWNQELGWKWECAKGVVWIGAVYHRLIQNWILWSAVGNSPFWSSNNITSVRSRGLEQTLQWHKTLGKHWQYQLQAGYYLTRSTNEIALSKPRMEAGEQLVYVPVHQGFISLFLQRKNLTFQYRHRFTGKVRGIAEAVPAYDLGWVRVEQQFLRSSTRHSWRISLFLLSDNAWNREYRVIERRPMPGRSIQAGLNFTFL